MYRGWWTPTFDKYVFGQLLSISRIHPKSIAKLQISPDKVSDLLRQTQIQFSKSCRGHLLLNISYLISLCVMPKFNVQGPGPISSCRGRTIIQIVNVSGSGTFTSPSHDPNTAHFSFKSSRPSKNGSHCFELSLSVLVLLGYKYHYWNIDINQFMILNSVLLISLQNIFF